MGEGWGVLMEDCLIQIGREGCSYYIHGVYATGRHWIDLCRKGRGKTQKGHGQSLQWGGREGGRMRTFDDDDADDTLWFELRT